MLVSLDSSLWHPPWDMLHPDKKVESSLVKYSDLQEKRSTYIETTLSYLCNLAEKKASRKSLNQSNNGKLKLENGFSNLFFPQN